VRTLLHFSLVNSALGDVRVFNLASLGGDPAGSICRRAYRARRLPIALSRRPPSVRTGAPVLGALGCGPVDIDALGQAGVPEAAT